VVGKFDEAKAAAEAALKIADTDDERRSAQQTLQRVANAGARPGAGSAAMSPVNEADAPASGAGDPATLNERCQSGEVVACRQWVPFLER
jgi:hypothetical protein